MEWSTGSSITSGTYNTLIGWQAGQSNLVAGIRNIMIGANAYSTGDVSYGIALGYGAALTASNTIAIGSSGAGAITLATTATGGATITLPTFVVGYIPINMNGTVVKVPYYSN